MLILLEAHQQKKQMGNRRELWIMRRLYMLELEVQENLGHFQLIKIVKILSNRSQMLKI